MDFYLLSQIFALAATILSLLAFQQRKKIQILNYTVVAAICSVLHYVFLGAWSGVATKSVGVTRNIFAAYETGKQKTSKIAPLFFVTCYITMGIITYVSPASLLPVAAASIYTIAIYLENAERIRKVAVFTASLWLFYNIFVFSIVGIISEVIFIANDLVAIYRYRHQRKKKPSRGSPRG